MAGEAESRGKGATEGEGFTSGVRSDSDASAHAMAATLQASPAGAPVELAVGTILDEVYKVEKPIGRGAMGAVYLVTHQRLGRRFAAKVVSDYGAGSNRDSDAGQRLRNEARVASAIQHENIVDVTHLGQTPDGALFIVMELLEGSDLRARMNAHREAHPDAPWLPDDEAKLIGRGVLAGLGAAHGAGIVHRDLKPDNVFLVKKGDRTIPKIVDFGISKARGGNNPELHLTKTGQIIGTPLYMAPEQSRSTSDADARADLYSIGVLLYEVVTGALPFEASTLYDIIVKHATEPPRKPSLLRPSLPPAVEAVVLRCLEKKPEDRWQSADELLAAWNDAWEHGTAPVVVAKPALVATAPAAAPPSRAGGFPIVVVSIVVVAIAGYFAFASFRDPPPTNVAQPTTVAIEPPPPPPTTVAEPPPPPESVVVTVAPVILDHQLRTSPPGAHVFADGVEVGVTPYDFPIEDDATATFELRLHGYRNQTITIEADDADDVLTLRRSGGGSSIPTLAPH
jgi:serine/threonine-protein kinase